MRPTLALLGLVASAAAQAVTEAIVPSSTPAAGCQNSRQGTFTISIQNVTTANATSTMPTRRSWDFLRARDVGSIVPRQQDGVLTLSLRGGILTDQANRTGYVASNYQFQFDAPPQAGAIYTAGFGLCSNGSISIGGSAVWWQCLSGSFYNLYDRDWAEHCLPVYLVAIEGAGQVYSTRPPVPVTTGPDQNTIANGGGTQTRSATGGTGLGVSSTANGTASATGLGGSASSGASSASGSASSAASSASGSASSVSSSASAAVSSATASASAAASSSGLAAMATAVPQVVFAWAAGIVGAVALV